MILGTAAYGERFVAIQPLDQPESADDVGIVVVENWFAVFKGRK